MDTHDRIGVTVVATEEGVTIERKEVTIAAAQEDVQGTPVIADAATASDSEERTTTLITLTGTMVLRRTAQGVQRGGRTGRQAAEVQGQPGGVAAGHGRHGVQGACA